MKKFNDSNISPFLASHSDFHNVFYDTDFVKIRKLVKELGDVLKIMTLRFDRHESLKIANSAFDYLTQKAMYYTYPQMYYDFRCADTRICIGRKSVHKEDHYFISCDGFTPSSMCKVKPSEFGYGDYKAITEALNGFYEIVYDFILAFSHILF